MEDEITVLSISEFKATCLKVLEQVRSTREPVMITKRGEPVAYVTPPPLPSTPEIWLGMLRGQGTISGDIVSPASALEDWEVLPE